MSFELDEHFNAVEQGLLRNYIVRLGRVNAAVMEDERGKVEKLLVNRVGDVGSVGTETGVVGNGEGGG